MKKPVEILSNGLLLLITLFCLLIAAEGVTRLIMPNMVKVRLMHKPDEKLGYRLVPNYEMTHQTSEFSTPIRINSEGLRDHEYPAEKDPNVFRILVLGDSFTFGVGVNIEDTYPKVLETEFNRRSTDAKHKRFEVVNAGVQGYGTLQEYLYLQELLRRFSPDLVIVGLYCNDVADVMAGIPSATFRNKLKNSFYFLSYLRGLQLLAFRSLGIGAQKRLFDIYQSPLTPQLDKALQLTREYLLKIHDDSRLYGARTLIVIIPASLEIDKSEWEKRGFGHMYTDEFFVKNMGRFSDTFTEFGSRNGIPTLPLLQVFRHNKSQHLYFDRDPHWTKEGHRLAAETIYNYLEKEGLASLSVSDPGRIQ